MGADEPKWGKTSTGSESTSLPRFLVVGLLLLSGTLILRVAFSSEGEAPKLNPKDEARLAKKLREIDDAEQYALVAKSDGWYPCQNNGFQTYFLKTGEVWKYGVTTKGQLGRYKGAYLYNNKVIYLIQFRGNIAECLKMEQINLFMYPFLPENLARPLELQLPRPPYNPIMN